MIFVDTGIWYSANVAEDSCHQAARELLLDAQSDLITTDYVIDELLTLLSVRGHRRIAVQIGDDFWSHKFCEIVWTKPADVAAGWKIFTTFDDKTWSFTDCVSYAVMKRFNITQAFALDDDFQQFGFLVVKP